MADAGFTGSCIWVQAVMQSVRHNFDCQSSTATILAADCCCRLVQWGNSCGKCWLHHAILGCKGNARCWKQILRRFTKQHVDVAGWSNVATAVAGAGFTGSYIFSQTIFTMRSGVHSRINGFAIALMMLLIFAAPFSVIEYLPSYFFGSLMMWIGWEIARVCSSQFHSV